MAVAQGLCTVFVLECPLSLNLAVRISFSIHIPSQNLFLLSGSSHYEHYEVVSTVSGATEKI